MKSARTRFELKRDEIDQRLQDDVRNGNIRMINAVRFELNETQTMIRKAKRVNFEEKNGSQGVMGSGKGEQTELDGDRIGK